MKYLSHFSTSHKDKQPDQQNGWKSILVITRQCAQTLFLPTRLTSVNRLGRSLPNNRPPLIYQNSARQRGLGHKQRKLNDVFYSFLLFVFCRPRCHAEFYYIKSGLFGGDCQQKRAKVFIFFIRIRFHLINSLCLWFSLLFA